MANLHVKFLHQSDCLATNLAIYRVSLRSPIIESCGWQLCLVCECAFQLHFSQSSLVAFQFQRQQEAGLISLSYKNYQKKSFTIPQSLSLLPLFSIFAQFIWADYQQYSHHTPTRLFLFTKILFNANFFSQHYTFKPAPSSVMLGW